MKTCSGCLKDKPVECFYTEQRKGKTYVRPRCKACHDEGVANWQAANPDKHKAASRRSQLRRFGLTLEEYEARVAALDGRCELCRRTPIKRSLAVDHDHKTGEIRGLLCHQCNIALGYFQDSPELLRKAALYLEKT